MCKVAILDSFTLFSSAIESILKDTHKCDIIIQAKDCDDLLKQLKGVALDVIIIDVIHGDNSGMRNIKKVRRNYRKVPVLLILNENYSDYIEEYIRLGVKGFVFSDANRNDLVEAIKRLKNGGEFFRTKVWDMFKTAIQKRKYKRKEDHVLTDREVAVLKLFTNGLTYKEIGMKLNISPRTVETHKRNILSKLKINTTADMVRYAFHHHIFT
ncbi:MAG TPA: response regulator transcription factor [Draconibacterium sp.]|nr:response regulator transcription factor [Draconibacterium sp.]